MLFTRAIVLLLVGSLFGFPLRAEVAALAITPTEARAIAKEAYVYGFPMVDGYRIQHAYFVDTKSPEYKGPPNKIVSYSRVFTPADTAVQTPNSDTPYSFLYLDLRAEPLVLTVPAIDRSRYFSVQLIDLYTFNFDYIGSRETGNGGGSYVIAGPGWKGAAPKGVSKVIRSETELALAIYRTQLFDPADMDKVKIIQAAYKVQPLSAFLGQQGPKSPPAIRFVEPLTREQETNSLRFFNVLNFLLTYAPTASSERTLMARFARIGVGAGKTIDIDKLSPEMESALQAGMADAWQEQALLKKRIDDGLVKSGDIFGTRAYLKNNYSYRMAAAALGIYGNSKEEAMYPVYGVDESGQKLDGSHQYTVHFAKEQMPPVHAFWSLTMYDMPASLLVANPIHRYLVNSPMLPQFVRDADGGITFYVQNTSPGADKEANWLPSPKGPFVVVMRLYWPEKPATDGEWKQPPMKKVASQIITSPET